MMHLNRIKALASVNLMTSQNLGVVFGRELHLAFLRLLSPSRLFSIVCRWTAVRIAS